MKSRKMLGAVALLGALLLVAAGCSKKTTGGAAGGGATQKCQKDQFGCIVYKPGEPIKLGTLLAISGDVAFLGTDSQHGAQLALDYLDGKFDKNIGLTLGHTWSMINEDDLCSKDGGQAGGTKLAAEPNLVAVIGTSCSSSALGVADKILSDKGIILLSPSNTNPNLTAEGTHQPFYARTAHNDKIQGAIVADFAFSKLQLNNAATIHDESPYADALAAVFRDVFKSKGGHITPNGDQAIQSTDTDFKPLLTTIAQDKPEFLYFPDFDPACALIAKQAAEVPGLENTVLAGSDGCLESAFLKTGGQAVFGTYASGPDLSSIKQGTFYASTFLTAYKDQFGTAPTASFHAHAYDAVNILVDAIKKVGIRGSDGTLSIPRTALKDALLKTSGYKGLTGTLTCTPLGDCATDVTIAVYKAPDFPVEGGNPNSQPVFSETKSLTDVGG
ncbi:MAG TPA: branched-chain amino acid ABC transporter substrate-binding protein [Actinomycetota bacterium]|jgi:branched-chain amino acid transport system substrate-binding protein